MLSLCKAVGVDASRVRRIVIDAEVGNAIKVYIDMFGTDELLTVDFSTTEIKIKTEERGITQNAPDLA